jgi:hypothetical protein
MNSTDERIIRPGQERLMVTSRCPFAEWRPLPEATSQPAITPRTVIFHTMVGSIKGTEKHFTDNTGLESHFGVGGPTDGASLDGALWQWMDLRREADANLDANAFAISIETSDGGDPNRPWSAKQLETLVRVGNWLADHFNIPRRACPAWDASGFGWHVMFGAPSHWTPVAKTCPGAVRIKQLREIVLPAIFAGRELDMTVDELRDEFTAGGDSTVRGAVLELAKRALVEELTIGGSQTRVAIRELAGLAVADKAAEVAAAVVAALPVGSVDAAVVQAAVETALNATVLQVAPA